MALYVTVEQSEACFLMYICACIWILACWLHVSTWCCIIFVLKWCVAEYYEHTSVVISSKEKALFLEHWVITQYVSLLFSFWSLGWDACLYWDKLKWNQAYPYKLVAVWMKVLLIFWLAMPLTVVADILTESYHCFQKCKKTQDANFFYKHLPNCHEIMLSVGSNGS